MGTISDLLDNIAASLKVLEMLRFEYTHEPRDYNKIESIIRNNDVLLIRFEQLGKSVMFATRNSVTDRLWHTIRRIGEREVLKEVDRLFANAPHFKNLRRVEFGFERYELHVILLAYFMTQAFDDLDSVKVTLLEDPAFADRSTHPPSECRYDLHFIAMVHDIGKLVLAELFPDIYQTVKQHFLNRISDYEDVIHNESILLKEKFSKEGIRPNMDHCLFAGLVLKRLQFHKSLQRAVTDHHCDKPESTPIAVYMYLCHSLFARNLVDPDTSGYVARIDTDVLDAFTRKYSVTEDSVRQVLSKVGNRVQAYMRYFCDLEQEPSGSFSIMDEDPTERVYRQINNAIFDTLEPMQENEQLDVIDKLVRRLKRRAKGYYTKVHYLSVDIAEHTKTLKSLGNPVAAERSMGAFHDFIFY